MDCTVKKYLKIIEGRMADYKPLSRFHYRDCKTGPVAKVYKIIDTHPVRRNIEPVAGVIVYCMPTINVQLRNIATEGLFSKLGKNNTALELVNANLRTISRVIIEPRYRSLGLAHELVKETMPLLKMPYIESLAVMGKVIPFFDKAGMLKFQMAEPLRHKILKSALSAVGIEQQYLIDIECVHEKIEQLNSKPRDFIEKHIKDFLSAYGRRMRRLQHSIARTEIILAKLSDRPVYYLWRNTKISIKI